MGHQVSVRRSGDAYTVTVSSSPAFEVTARDPQAMLDALEVELIDRVDCDELTGPDALRIYTAAFKQVKADLVLDAGR